MKLLLGQNRASCSIICPWEPVSERSDKYASVVLIDRVSKRKHRTSGKRQASCVIQAGVWSAVKSASGSVAKTFRKVSSSESIIQGWNGKCELLAVNDAIDSSVYLSFTWLLVRLAKKNGTQGIALLLFTRDGLQLKRAWEIDQKPVSGVVLRGPQVLYCTASDIAVLRPDCVVPLVSPLLTHLSSKPVQRFVCSAEHDVEGFLFTFDSNAAAQALRCYSVRVSGGQCEELWATECCAESIAAVAVSTRRGIMAAAQADGRVRVFDIHSGQAICEAKPCKEMQKPLSLVFYEEELLVSSTNSEAVWAVASNASGGVEGASKSRLLFPPECLAAASQQHGHFLARWRNLLLQCSDANGLNCADKEIATHKGPGPGSSQRGQDFQQMFAVTRNLERRLDLGVQQVTDAAQKREDKECLLAQSTDLLAKASGASSYMSQRNPFRGRLENVLELPERRQPISEVLPVDDGSELNVSAASGQIVVDGRSEPDGSSRFVRLLNSITGVDKSKRFILIQTQVSLLGTGRHKRDHPVPKLTLQLSAEFSRSISAVWEVEKKSLLPGTTAWLHACAPISAVVSNSSSALFELSVVVRVDSDDGRSQLLGNFSLPALLSRAAPFKTVSQPRSKLLTFENRIHAVAQGTAAHELERFPTESKDPKGFQVNVRDNLALIYFTVSSNIELALRIAKLRASIADGVKLRSSVEPSRKPLEIVDKSLRLLESEMNTVHRAGSERGEVGYETIRILDVLRGQVTVDDCFGCLEELYLGV